MKIKNKDVIDLYLLLKEKEKEFKNDEEKCKLFLNNLSEEDIKIYNYKNKHPEIVINYLKTKKVPKVKLTLKGNDHYCLIRDIKTNNIFLVISDINNKLQILKWSKNCNHSLDKEFNVNEDWINEIFPYLEKRNGNFELSFEKTEKIIGKINNEKIIFKSGIYEI